LKAFLEKHGKTLTPMEERQGDRLKDYFYGDDRDDDDLDDDQLYLDDDKNDFNDGDIDMMPENFNDNDDD